MTDQPTLLCDEQDDALICTFSGRLDTTACAQVEADVIARVTAASGPVVFDLAGVDYVASMFFRLCLQATKLVGAARFSLVHVQPPVRRVFKIAGLDTMIH